MTFTLGGAVAKHTETPRISPTPVNVSDASTYPDIGGTSENALVITHGYDACYFAETEATHI